MVNGISGSAGREMAQLIAQQRAASAPTRADHDGDQDDGGPARSGPDTDYPADTPAAGGVKGTLFHGIA